MKEIEKKEKRNEIPDSPDRKLFPAKFRDVRLAKFSRATQRPRCIKMHPRIISVPGEEPRWKILKIK